MIEGHSERRTVRAWSGRVLGALLALLLLAAPTVYAAAGGGAVDFDFPRSVESYDDAHMEGIGERLAHRARMEPFNVVATAIFLLAILHTFLSSKFLALAHHWEHEHQEKIEAGTAPRRSMSHKAELFHFLGEVEAVFGIWAIALGIAVASFFDWSTFVGYLTHRVNFTEAMFVVVIMTLASTRPILVLAEGLMGRVAKLLGGNLAAWWLTILTLGPLMGSIITEPAAMTISAMLLARKFYDLQPSPAFSYATIGLLFVNVSVGGTLTHFAAPPVLMVAAPFGWDTPFMLANFGWKATLGILVANGIYFMVFRKQMDELQHRFEVRSLKDQIHREYITRELAEGKLDEIVANMDEERQTMKRMQSLLDEDVDHVREHMEPQYLDYVASHGIDRELAMEAFNERFEELKLARLREELPGLLPADKRPKFIDPEWDTRDDPVPAWVIIFHVAFLGWTVLNAHYPPLFIAGMLFFLGFAVVTSSYQNRIDLKPALLVGFFLAGLVIHGGFQAWWIEPVLGSLSEVPLMAAATILTAFNDNAAITYLTSLIPGLGEELKYAAVAGAVAGGGLTVIANAPNPAGQALLKRYFENGVSPIHLLAGALLPTLIVWLALLLLG